MNQINIRIHSWYFQWDHQYTYEEFFCFLLFNKKETLSIEPEYQLLCYNSKVIAKMTQGILSAVFGLNRCENLHLVNDKSSISGQFL